MQTWLGNSKNPEDWGWQKTETLFLPIRTTEPLAPIDLLKLVHCSCSTSNCSKNCSCKKAGMKCTRACKGCKGESCSNATDLVQLTENADEDEEDDEDESLDYISEIELEKRNTKRLAYEKLKRSIYGLEDTDSEEEVAVEEEGEEEDHAVEETVAVSRTSDVDEPSTSRISPLKKRRKRQI